MIVTKKVPAPFKCPVEIAKDKYEMWYSKPVNLGTIENRGGIWYTEDGMKFVSSRDALEYLSTLHDLDLSVATAPEDIKKIAAQEVYQKREKKTRKLGRKSRKSNSIQLPAGVSMESLKQLIAVAEKLSSVLNAPVPTKGKKNDRLGEVQVAASGS